MYNVPLSHGILTEKFNFSIILVIQGQLQGPFKFKVIKMLIPRSKI